MPRHPEKDRNTVTRPVEGKTPTLAPPPLSEAPAEEATPSRKLSLVWLAVLVVWVGAALLLWGSEIIRLVYRMFSATPPG